MDYASSLRGRRMRSPTDDRDLRDLQHDIECAADLLRVFAIDAGQPNRLVTDQERDAQWHRVEYLARTIATHAALLGDFINDLERRGAE
ncbi:MAG: hypothetical protein AB7U95_22385 [Reyranella sp.]